MRLPTLLLPLSLLFTSLLAQSTSTPTTHTLQISAWPLTAASSTPLARISYSYPSLNASIDSWTPPSPPTAKSKTGRSGAGDTDLIRIGFHDPVKQHWRGVVTSAASFEPQFQRRVSLHVDGNGVVFHVGVAAWRAAGGDGKQEPEVEVVPVRRGPEPVLDKPVVVSEDGKVEGAVAEKTFLQKYWWALALFILVQVVMGGGGDK
ncbi:hypothetical protein LTR16_005046 [Cryomyces antarcticus]|uniref:ER membrane protein complex subunit 10 n=1 Tax=Cryomyces antarcticus TaxID=329879 RepID=A0ABR0LMP8_9PEZI|nr:hypothetical protein LTR16_005046 [Cryomyces antarcticus]